VKRDMQIIFKNLIIDFYYYALMLAIALFTAAITKHFIQSIKSAVLTVSLNTGYSVLRLVHYILVNLHKFDR